MRSLVVFMVDLALTALVMAAIEQAKHLYRRFRPRPGPGGDGGIGVWRFEPHRRGGGPHAPQPGRGCGPRRAAPARRAGPRVP